MNDTTIVYLCHVISDEAKRRYDAIKDGAKCYGYSTVWLLDITFNKNAKEQLMQQYGISQDEILTFSFTDIPAEDKVKLFYAKVGNIIFTNANTFAFYTAAKNLKTKHIWIVEYDVCYIGEWKDFFAKYDKDKETDLIVFSPIHVNNVKWMHYPTENGLKKLNEDNIKILDTLTCCVRLSQNAINAILEFYEKYNIFNDIHIELAFITACVNKHLNVKLSEMKYFTCWAFKQYLGITIDKFSKGQLVHPIKLDETICDMNI